ncbi:hypothetical protein Tco_0679449 [Tanacetum coccineum]|uniref:Uncharacterized protein n=1 Tax=Tanacetum coccineum TaxID=301880 RepID=A0ABQ4XJ44_9ASTR
MSITKEQQQALDDALVPREQRLRIANCNCRLSTTFKPKELTFQVALDFYPNLLGQKFEDPPFEEDILAFIRELAYPGDIKSLSDVKVDTLYQPWRTFGTIINKCLSGKATGLDLGLKSFVYGAILLDTLTNQAMKESEAYKTYHDFSTGKVIPKPKVIPALTTYGSKDDQMFWEVPVTRTR